MLNQNGAPQMPEFFVGKTITGERIARFIQTKHALLSNALGKPDTKFIWYSRNHVAQWLSEIDRAGGDGMRVYFGAQGEQEAYPGQLCLLMVLTMADPLTGGHTNITVEDAPDFIDRQLTPEEVEAIHRDFNTGSPCPPLCDGKEPIFP
ncbi:MAG: hypothetical protein J7497_14395 [Chitinophagaceae bacterium]|nr:hypothetical protein [Chitinophagaceae bacterium]